MTAAKVISYATLCGNHPSGPSALDDLDVFTSTSRVSHRCKLMQTDTKSDAIVAFGQTLEGCSKAGSAVGDQEQTKVPTMYQQAIKQVSIQR